MCLVYYFKRKKQNKGVNFAKWFAFGHNIFIEKTPDLAQRILCDLIITLQCAMTLSQGHLTCQGHVINKASIKMRPIREVGGGCG